MDMCKSVKVKFTNRAIGVCKGYWVVYMGKMCGIEQYIKVLNGHVQKC